ncbi:hypothetical protein NDU88_007101 [Pleurodeles waltl]|uniref:Uncharacterized protein n=1 Tax=Pleurodeles waltl TaxID=8319 RepID=A0AAV7MLZ8_PLEWA|nr:hypothetical protein NDU88_007101 [Pleurodeles waltl]
MEGTHRQEPVVDSAGALLVLWSLKKGSTLAVHGDASYGSWMVLVCARCPRIELRREEEKRLEGEYKTTFADGSEKVCHPDVSSHTALPVLVSASTDDASLEALWNSRHPSPLSSEAARPHLWA